MSLGLIEIITDNLTPNQIVNNIVKFFKIWNMEIMKLKDILIVADTWKDLGGSLK